MSRTPAERPRRCPSGALGGNLNQELPTPAQFEATVELVTEDDVADTVVCGADPERHLESIRRFEVAGFDHVYVHQVGPYQDGFMRFYQTEIIPQVTGAAAALNAGAVRAELLHVLMLPDFEWPTGPASSGATPQSRATKPPSSDVDYLDVMGLRRVGGNAQRRAGWFAVCAKPRRLEDGNDKPVKGAAIGWVRESPGVGGENHRRTSSDHREVPSLKARSSQNGGSGGPPLRRLARAHRILLVGRCVAVDAQEVPDAANARDRAHPLAKAKDVIGCIQLASELGYPVHDRERDPIVGHLRRPEYLASNPIYERRVVRVAVVWAG